jgi:hypothetical protein
MRTLLACLLAVSASLSPVFAGRLDIAVIQFPEEKTPEELDAALARVNLFEMTNSNRTMTREPYLKGGYVLFAQSLSVSPGATFGSSTRIKDERAEVQGSYTGGTLSVTIDISEGVKAGLRSFQNKVYSGSGSLPAGAPAVISLRRIKGKSTQVVKGQSRLEQYQLSTAIIAQYTP